MKITVTVPRIERFNGHSYQEITLSTVANALASRLVADSVNLMERVRHVIAESGFFENPLAIRGDQLRKHQKQDSHHYFLVHNLLLPFQTYCQYRGAVRRSRYDSHRSMRTRDAVNLFSPAPLIIGHRSQNGCQYHPRTMYPFQSFV